MAWPCRASHKPDSLQLLLIAAVLSVWGTARHDSLATMPGGAGISRAPAPALLTSGFSSGRGYGGRGRQLVAALAGTEFEDDDAGPLPR